MSIPQIAKSDLRMFLNNWGRSRGGRDGGEDCGNYAISIEKAGGTMRDRTN